MRSTTIVLFAALLSSGCSNIEGQNGTRETAVTEGNQNMEKATFAGGCFWCMEPPFEKLDGVQAVISGYTGGHVENPTYEAVCGGGTGHLEAIQVLYDPEVIDYEKLMDVFWRQIDPTDAGGSFVDRGSQYASAIFYHDDAQKASAEASKKALDASGRYPAPIATEIRPLTQFYPAEDYHQDYYKKSTKHYKSYRKNSGRDQYIRKTWEDDPASKE